MKMLHVKSQRGGRHAQVLSDDASRESVRTALHEHAEKRQPGVMRKRRQSLHRVIAVHRQLVHFEESQIIS
jgi:hypothetical protein